jgi:hypothetical protein
MRIALWSLVGAARVVLCVIRSSMYSLPYLEESIRLSFCILHFAFCEWLCVFESRDCALSGRWVEEAWICGGTVT